MWCLWGFSGVIPMNSTLLLDVAELALTHITNDSSVAFVEANKIYEEFISGETLCKSNASFEEFRSALKIMFPIYKNKKKHTHLFKISSHTAYAVCEERVLKLRPLSHINRL